MNANVLRAVFRRNFVSYFANPTGYVFICLFAFAGAAAAFWVPAFFNNNLANLDQLSFWFPYLMLVYVPTITMGIWADERKQGTDELLLTIPARDFDIVLGKYLAAVGIFTVALLFSLICNYFVLNNLASTDAWSALAPQIDLGLFLGTYFGYWLIGLSMLAVGLIGSFLTSNVTIGFVFGVMLNIPLVFLASADVMIGGIGRQFVLAVERWSISERFADFSRGVLTLTGIAYFLMIVAVMLYVSMILIGRRHWFTGSQRWLQAGHFALRTLAVVTIAWGVVVVFQHCDVRADISSEHLSSLSPQTVELIRNLKVDHPVQIEAFISPNVPESYLQTRLNLLTVLREFQALGGPKVHVQIHEAEQYSSDAALAEKRYRITPYQVSSINHGKVSVEHIFLNVAMSCGVQTAPPVFINRGIPVEYELVRSLATVAQQQRKKLGVLQTDAQLYGSFNMQNFSANPNWPIIDELEKQYEVVKVDPAKPITEKYDVLLAVQPSSLGSQEMDNFVAAVAGGQPTAIFEDPAPVLGMGVPATSMPRQPPGGMNPMFGGQQPPPKGDIRKLWDLLGVDFAADQVIWQDYNPYPAASQFPSEFVFIDQGCGNKDPFGAADKGKADEISAGLQQLLFPFPGAVAKLNTSNLTFTPLAITGDRTGTVRFGQIMQMTPFGPRGGLNPNRRQIPTNTSYVLAAHIQGEAPVATPAGNAEKDKQSRKAKIDVVIVSDIDMLSQDFFRLREQGDMPELGMSFDFDNVTFVLNVLDELAGDDRFIDIRKRRLHHHTLTRIEERTKKARQETIQQREKFVKDYEAAEEKEQQALLDKIAELQKRKNVDPQQMLIEVAMEKQHREQEKEAKMAQARRDRDQSVNQIETDLKNKVRQVQEQYKWWAVVLPPIPPLLVAAFVFFTRRAREREGVARSRLR